MKRGKILPLALALCLCLTLLPGTASAATVSDYTFIEPIDAPDPNAIPISTAAELAAIENDLSGSYVLTDDIDLSNYNGGVWESIGEVQDGVLASGDSGDPYPESTFYGTLDGQGHAITGSLVESETIYDFSYSLFSFNGGTIKNLGDTVSNLRLADNNVNSGEFYNCWRTGDVSADASGICGQNTGRIEYCYFNGDIEGHIFPQAVGAIACLNDGYIGNCYVAGSINVSFPVNGEATCAVGGIAGFNVGDVGRECLIYNCANYADISSHNIGGTYFVGGICGLQSTGYNSVSIENCLNAGIVFASSDFGYAGGISGLGLSNSDMVPDAENIISGCVVVSAEITGYGQDYTGGIVPPEGVHGANFTYSNNYVLENTETSPDYYTQMTPEQATSRAFYESLGWDFENTWCFREGSEYPQLISNSNRVETVAPFTDVFVTDWYADAVRYVNDNGIMNGTSNSKFDPNGKLSRAMMATVLYRLEGEPATAYKPSFTDVPSGQWYSESVTWASENGIVIGYGGGIFGSSDDLTREQFATILHRYARMKGYDVSAAANLAGFSDAGTISDWALSAMRWAVAEELINGTTDTTLDPSGTTTRAQCATVLMRFVSNPGNDTPSPQPQTRDGTFYYHYYPDLEFALTGLQPNCIAVGYAWTITYGDYILVFDDDGTVTFSTDFMVGVADDSPILKAGKVYNISDINGLKLIFIGSMGPSITFSTESKLSGLIESYGDRYSSIIPDIPVEDVLTESNSNV